MTPFKVYDTETMFMADEVEHGWKNIYGMGLASCVVYDSENDQYHFFGPGDEGRTKCCEFLSGDKHIVVGFNSVNFDSRLLLGDRRWLKGHKVHWIQNDKEYGWNEVDIYLEIFKRVTGEDDYQKVLDRMRKDPTCRKKGVWNLNTLCKCTLGKTKNGTSEDGPKLYKENRWPELFQYNLQDTRLTKDLYLFMKEYKYIINGEFDVVKF